MLDNLTQRLAKVVKTMRGEARLTESNTAEMLREVRLALLEADVALPAVREFIAKVKEKALGEDVISSLTPGQALVGVVQRELASLMGADLGDSLHFFMGLKLKAGLNELAMDKPVTGAIDVEKLSSLDRDLLKDTLGVVKRFKAQLRLRFHLEAA